MSVIQIYLEPDRGGNHEFSEIADAILWCQQQRESWNVQFRAVFQDYPSHPILEVVRAWESVISRLQVERQSGKPVALSIDDQPHLIVPGSPVSDALAWVAQFLPASGLTAAAAIEEMPGARVNWSEPSQATAALLYERTLHKISQVRSAETLEPLEKKAVQLSAGLSLSEISLSKLDEHLKNITDVANHSMDANNKRLGEIDTLIGSLDFETKVKLQEIEQTLATTATSASSMLENLTASSKEAVDQWIDGFQEQRKLEAPVKLWEDRAIAHGLALNGRKWWMLGVGVVGLAACVGVSVGAFTAAKSLFSDAIVLAADGKSSGVAGMRASFHFELLLSSAATLLYLTMYLWAMRILVRLYTAEHHLSIDAQGRAALTETYLSLRKDGAATDADRAIMLSVIFRPVTDGMVKEDGPPAMTPSAILASLASGSAKTGS